jgi:hypothetical protein
MVKPLTPKQLRDYERLDGERKRAETIISQAEKISGRNSAEHFVALRERDEIMAKMNRLIPQSAPPPVAQALPRSGPILEVVKRRTWAR